MVWTAETIDWQTGDGLDGGGVAEKDGPGDGLDRGPGGGANIVARWEGELAGGAGSDGAGVPEVARQRQWPEPPPPAGCLVRRLCWAPEAHRGGGRVRDEPRWKDSVYGMGTERN